jgi:hypothetical protein
MLRSNSAFSTQTGLIMRGTLLPRPSCAMITNRDNWPWILRYMLKTRVWESRQTRISGWTHFFRNLAIYDIRKELVYLNDIKWVVLWFRRLVAGLSQRRVRSQAGLHAICGGQSRTGKDLLPVLPKILHTIHSFWPTLYSVANDSVVKTVKYTRQVMYV